MTNAPDRLRQPPRERFDGREFVYDLHRAFAELPAESVPRQGHMQKALYKHGPLTTAIFAFEPGAEIEPHAVEGPAIIHVLEGDVEVRTLGATHRLTGGQVMLLDSGVEHDVRANAATRMMLTIVLDAAD